MAHRYMRFLRRLLRDRCGQDMVEYALLAGFVAVAAGATLPGIADDLGTIYSKMESVTSAAAGTGQPGRRSANDNPTGSSKDSPTTSPDGTSGGSPNFF